MNGDYHHQTSQFRYLHFFISRLQALEDQQEEFDARNSGPITITPPRGITTELRAMKPLPKRRVTRRTRSNSPPLIQDRHEVKRPRLSGTR